MPNSIRFGRTAESTLTRQTNLPGLAAFTMMAWVRVVTSGSALLLYYGQDGAAGTAYFAFLNGTTLTMHNGSTDTTGSTLTIGRWYHVTMAVNGTSGSNAFVWLDGVLDITMTAIGTNPDQRVQIGGSQTNDPLDGNVAAYKEWKRVLTIDEINNERYTARALNRAGLNAELSIPTVLERMSNDIRPTQEFGVTTRWFDSAGLGNDWVENESGTVARSGSIDTESGPPILYAPSRFQRRSRIQPAGGVNYVTNQTGDWNNSAIWTPTGVPGNTDTATINHAVTVSDTRIVGTSPASATTPVALAVATGSLTVQSTGNLTVRGPITIADVALTVDGDGIFEIDASQATSPTTRLYQAQIGTANNQANSYFVANGSSGHPAIIRSNSGGGAGYFNGGQVWTRGGKFKLTYANITKIGDATNRSFDYDLNSNAADSCWADDCIFDNCGGTYNGGGAVHDGSLFRMLRTTFKNSGSNQLTRFGSNLSLGAGTRSVTFCIFDTQPTLLNGTGFTIDDNIFYEAPALIGSATTSCARNMIRLVSTVAPMTTIATLTDCYILFDQTGFSNPHFLSPDSGGTSHNYDGLIFEFTGTNGEGDCILPQTPGSALTWLALRCIVLPNSSLTANTGTLFTLGGNANVTIGEDHCTIFAQGVNSGITTGEGSYAGHAGMVTYLKNSIVWGPVASDGFKIYASTDTAPANDIVSAANADYNCGYRLAAGAEGKGYDVPMTGTPGAHDVQADPQFTAPTRRSTAFDTSLGGPGTTANLMTELMKRNDRSGWNTAYTVNALLQYVRAGFIPQNAAVRGTALDGTVMGAVQDVLPSFGPLVSDQFCRIVQYPG